MKSSKKITKGFISDFISDSTQSALDLKANINNPTFTGNVVVPNADASNEAINKGQLDAAISGVTSSAPDATTTSKGIIQLGGDLSGTASAPTVPALASKENTSNKQNSLNYDGTGVKFPTVDAVSYITREIAKAATKTGLMSKKDNFNLIPLDNFTLRITSIDDAMFWNELFTLTLPPPNAIKSFAQKDYPLTQLVTATGGNVNVNPLTTDGKYVRYIGYDKNGNVYSSLTTMISNNDILQLGFVTVLKTGSTVQFLDGTAGPRNVFAQPNIASNTDFDQVSATTTNISISANAAASFSTSNGNITGICVNWKSASNPTNSSPIDVFNYTGVNPAAFRNINPLFLSGTASLSTHTLWTDTEDGIAINSKFFNTTTQASGTMNNNSASVKRIMVGVRGSIYIQDGEHATTECYPDLATAKSNIYNHKFSDAIIPPGVAFEIARVAYMKGASTFTDTTQFYIVNTAGSSSGGSSTIPPVSDATTATKGIVQLTGALGGTADNPTTPTAVHLTGNEIITGDKAVNNTGATPSRYRAITASDATIPGIYTATASTTNPSIYSTTNGNSTIAIESHVNFPSATGLRVLDDDLNPNSTARLLVLENKLSTNNGMPLTVIKGGITVATISDIGNISGNSFIKASAGATDALMGNGTTNVIDSGTYVPTATNNSGTSALGAFTSYYSRIGNIVTVNAAINLTATTSAAVLSFDISLPIARASSTLLSFIGSGGVLNTADATIQSNPYMNSSTTTTARISFYAPVSTGTYDVTVTFMYSLT